MEAFSENIRQSARQYEKAVEAGVNFNDRYLVDPQTGASRKISLGARLTGKGNATPDARLEIAIKILDDVAGRSENISVGSSDSLQVCCSKLQGCREMLQEVKLAKAILRHGAWGATAAPAMREADAKLSARAYFLNQEIQAHLAKVNDKLDPYLREGVNQGWLKLETVDSDWVPPSSSSGMDFGKPICRVYIQGDTAHLYTKGVDNKFGFSVIFKPPQTVNLSSESLTAKIGDAVTAYNASMVEGYRSFWNRSSPDQPQIKVSRADAGRYEEIFTKQWEKPFFSRDVGVSSMELTLHFIERSGEPHLAISWLDPFTLERRTEHKEIDAEPPEVWVQRKAEWYYNIVDSMPDPLQDLPQLSEVQPEEWDQIVVYASAQNPLPRTMTGVGTMIGVERGEKEVTIFRRNPQTGHRENIRIPIEDRPTLTHTLQRLRNEHILPIARQRLKWMYEDIMKHAPKARASFKGNAIELRDYGRASTPSIKNGEFTKPILTISTCHTAESEIDAIHQIANWDAARRDYNIRRKQLVRGGPRELSGCSTRLTFKWSRKHDALMAILDHQSGARSHRHVEIPLYTLKELEEENLLRLMAVFDQVAILDKVCAEVSNISYSSAPPEAVGAVTLSSADSLSAGASYLNAKGEVVTVPLDPMGFNTLDQLQAITQAAQAEFDKMWETLREPKSFGLITLNAERQGDTITVTLQSPLTSVPPFEIDSLEDVQNAIERLQTEIRLPLVLGGGSFLEIPPAPADVPIRAVLDLARNTAFFEPIETLVDNIENRVPYIGVPADAQLREEWYQKLETLVRLSTKHFSEHPDPGKQMVYIAGMADALNACGIAWMDQAFMQYLDISQPEKARQVREPGPRLAGLLEGAKRDIIDRLTDYYVDQALRQGDRYYTDPRHMRNYLVKVLAEPLGLPTLNIVDPLAPDRHMNSGEVLELFKEEFLYTYTRDRLIDHIYQSMIDSMDKGEVSELFGPVIVKMIEDAVEQGKTDSIRIGGEPALSADDAAADSFDPYTWGPANFWEGGVLTRDGMELLLIKFGFIAPYDEVLHLA